MSNNNENKNNNNSTDSDEDQQPQIPYRRDRTPSIVVQSLGLSFHKDSNITESIELSNDDEQLEDNLSQQSNNSPIGVNSRGSNSAIDDDQNNNANNSSNSSNNNFNQIQNRKENDSFASPSHGSQSSLHNASPISTTTGLISSPIRVGPASKSQRPPIRGLPNTNRRLSLNIGANAPRRQSLTVEGLGIVSGLGGGGGLIKEEYVGGNATGSLRNKVTLAPGHSLMGWIKLTTKNDFDLSGTGGRIIEVTPEELIKHDKVKDCWIVLKGNVYNVTKYLDFHPGGRDELMRAAGSDATELFNEVHRWVNFESLLSKCLVGPYRYDSPSTPTGRSTFINMSDMATTTTNQNTNTTKSTIEQTAQTGTTPTTTTNTSYTNTSKRDPTIAQKPPRRQSIALTVPSPDHYQSLLLNNNPSSSLNQMQEPPVYVIMQDKACIKVKIQDIKTLPLIRSRHLICDLNQLMELHISIILSSDWLYRVHLKLDQKVEGKVLTDLSSEEGTITIQVNKLEQGIWNKIGTSMGLNDSLCETTLADKYFRPCQLSNKKQLTHDTYLFEFKLNNTNNSTTTLMHVPICCHILMREFLQVEVGRRGKNKKNNDDNKESKNSSHNNEQFRYDDYRISKNYTPVLADLLSNDGFLDETGFMEKLYFIIKIYPNGVLTSKLNQLKIGDSIDISDYQSIDFDIENHVMLPKHWILLAAGTGITPFCRIISYLLLNQKNNENVKSVTLLFFNKTQKDIILRDQFEKLTKKHESKFKVIHILSDEPEQLNAKGVDNLKNANSNNNGVWMGKRGRISRELIAEQVDSHQPDELQFLACGPRPFTQLTKSLVSGFNLQEKLYIFHG